MLHLILSLFLSTFSLVSADTYSVKIGTDSHINVIDSKFLSFTIDPKYLFSSSEKYRSKECICMASSLTPAYIRIAGPSTALLSFRNATITITDTADDELKRVRFHDLFGDDLSREFKSRRELMSSEAFEGRFKRNHENIVVSHKEWRKFVHWAKTTGFDLVFALNNEEKMASGMWDPNTALNILTVAEKANVGDIFWQLGYECKNQSIEEYLNDLETLRVIIETYPLGRSGQWKVVGGDVTGCLQADSKSDFKDYVSLSNDMMDAILLNGNSSAQELERMSERDRLKLLKLLSRSATPLWLTEAPWWPLDELSRAADWLTSLGHAAVNGFSHHFRELGDEMYQPSLSFYMALLFKNLVGSKVLKVDMEPDQAIMFAHCTSLRHKAVPGAVTLYGVNMDDEPARFSIKLDRREEGGDIMQFILGQDSSGNIQVNGRPMYFEGDLKPVVKRVRPYKTLLLNLPAKSFGFWVLANTKINACFEKDDNNTDEDNIEVVTDDSEEIERFKSKRSVIDKDFEEYAALSDVAEDFFDAEDAIDAVNNKNLVKRMKDLNSDLNKVQDLFKSKPNDRLKRQIDDDRLSERRQKLRRQGLLLRNRQKPEPESNPRGIFANLIDKTRQFTRLNLTRRFKNAKRNPSKLLQNKVSKRNPTTRKHEFTKRRFTEKPSEIKDTETKVRNRRSVENPLELSVEHEVEVPKDNVKLWKILKKIHKQLKDLSEENEEEIEEDPKSVLSSEHVKDHDDDVSENDTGLFKTTVGNLMRVLSDLNKNLHNFWDTINLLD